MRPDEPLATTDRAATATVVGGGPGGLMAAEVLAGLGVAVTVFDHMPSVGRKFLLAGRGGLNLTHSEPFEQFLARYPAPDRLLEASLRSFGPDDLREWAARLGEPTFAGSSGRVFPRSFRATPLLRSWLARLRDLGVELAPRHRWVGWGSVDQDGPPASLFEAADGAIVEVANDVTVMALGGASWPRVGSTGTWTDQFGGRGIEVKPLRPANVGLRVVWSPVFAGRFAGTPLKGVSIAVDGMDAEAGTGDAMVTGAGLEGGPIYAVGAAVRTALDAGGCVLTVDLRPDVDAADLARRLAATRRPRDSASTWLRRAGIAPVAAGLAREATANQLPSDPVAMANLLKAVPVSVAATMGIDRAISSAGGVAFDELDDRFMLRRLPGVFVAGEMLDWEAPTGGYLLQATFSTAVAAAVGAHAWLEAHA